MVQKRGRKWFLFLFLGGPVCVLLGMLLERKLHRERKQRDEQMYKHQWEEAVRLLNFGGQLTNEQLELITPRPPGADSGVQPEPKIPPAILAAIEATRAGEDLPPMSYVLEEMSSEDRRKVEVGRAKHGLPPADTLEDMLSEDVRKVLKARAKYASLRSRTDNPPAIES